MSTVDDDERLLAELGDAVRARAEVPDRFVAAGKAAFAWRTVDAELAALSYDSATSPAGAGTRAEAASLRAMTFVASTLTIELEITGDALLGQIVPPRPGEVSVQTRHGTQAAVPVDEVGWFAVRPVPDRMFRLRLRTADGATVVTEWIDVAP